MNNLYSQVLDYQYSEIPLVTIPHFWVKKKLAKG